MIEPKNEVAKKIWWDLACRRGFWFDGIDDDIRQEIADAWDRICDQQQRLDDVMVRIASEEKAPWRPFASHNVGGDLIECYLAPGDHVFEFVNDQIGLYRDRETGEVVGVEISGVKDLLRVRDQEIEALAEKLYVSWNACDEGWTDEKDAFKCAEAFLNYRDEWRKAREQ